MKRRAAFAALFVIALAGGASAEPTLWERVRNPQALREAKLKGSLVRMVEDAELSALYGLGLDRELGRAAVAMFELAGADEPNDPELAVFEARALIAADLGRDAEARRLLEGAVSRLPPGVRAASAWNWLGDALVRSNDPEAERRAYTKVIELTWDPDDRARAYANRGDVAMQLHDLPGAFADYQKAVATARIQPDYTLASYGLAVAEERLGDMPAAYATLDKVRGFSLPSPPYAAEDPLDLPEVVFAPAYEENYLRALRAMALGRRSTDPSERHDAYEVAVAEWDLYLARSPDDEPFRENASRHRARAAHELETPVPRPAR